MPKISYRPARVFAMQLLYAMEITGQTPGEALPGILESQPLADEQKKYGMNLVDLVQAHRDELDEDIKSASAHWEIDRMAKLDRIVSRIAMVELLYVPDIPIKVAISEAVQIATKYSTDGSGAFVNGLLTGFMQKHNIVATTPTQKSKANKGV
ncbi:MAG: transcription antitermination factor NusB [Fibrobacter sp.]|jgi:N utilization substance protein B|uniref:transcription antitermination factor NusB n=1 Tax=unclassified Fibrobacter TaxID=2634177 RepID=UPI0009133586|nr:MULTISPECIES: transcription antitermination factor NusB [unclassified Fibrobacter]MBO6136948.1 transcription antitermination factor NusB [Fibrobacter sp.]MBQ3720174.1 transcription antitermination factor NusB [Fibrobacter sp.]MBR2059694.1 transcription antitermination factor NusB [Fibrobacter sp.]MBR2306759.1 transcription antitermination factor NusB [Fibrobacter sp.]SHG67958.1 NusB antitermination factor [Fibrobacter sp. UWCM]